MQVGLGWAGIGRRGQGEAAFRGLKEGYFRPPRKLDWRPWDDASCGDGPGICGLWPRRPESWGSAGAWFGPTFLSWLVPLLGGYLELGIVERRLNVGLCVEGAVPEECHPLFTVFACAVQGEDGIG